MKQTGAYQLNQWELTDRIRMEDFNSDNTKVDAALAALSGRVDAKAEQAALTALSGRVDATAEQSALNTLSGRVDTINSVVATKADKTALTNLENWVNTKDHYVKLLESTTSADASMVELSLSGIDWSLWQEVVVSVYVNIACTYKIYPNNWAYNCKWYTENGSRFDNNLLEAQASDSFVDIHLPCSRNPGRRVWMKIYATNYLSTATCYTSFSGLTALNFQSTGSTPVLAGTKFTVWGVR